MVIGRTVINWKIKSLQYFLAPLIKRQSLFLHSLWLTLVSGILCIGAFFVLCFLNIVTIGEILWLVYKIMKGMWSSHPLSLQTKSKYEKPENFHIFCNLPTSWDDCKWMNESKIDNRGEMHHLSPDQIVDIQDHEKINLVF